MITLAAGRRLGYLAVPGLDVAVPDVAEVADLANSDGLSGGIERYWSANRAIFWNTGAATVPPKIAP
jgi:hypothetical protein